MLVFRSRRPGRVKVLFHDGSGMVLVAKWPDRGSFRWPPVSEGLLRLSRVEFLALFDVCDWRGLKANGIQFVVGRVSPFGVDLQRIDLIA